MPVINDAEAKGHWHTPIHIICFLMSKIRYLRHEDIDKERWDHCIDESVNGIFYAHSWYLDMCARSWDALIEDDYRSVMPLPYRRKAGVTYIFQPHFTQQLGVFSRDSLRPEHTAGFLDAIPPAFRFADFSLNTYNSLPPAHKSIAGRGLTHELDLIQDYEQLRRNYSNNLKRNLRKAEQNELFVTSYGRPEDIIQAFREHRGRKLPYTEADYQLLKHLIYAGMHRGMARIRCAYSATNSFCAGIVFFTSHNKSVFLFSGYTPEARTNQAMSLLVDSFIREHAGSELVLDFEGSTNPNLARFYKGFGSKECVFLHIRMNRLPFFTRLAANAYLYIRKSLR